jgi:hypothetical protein
MADRLFNFFNDNPALIAYCPVCNQKFNPMEAKVLIEQEANYLLHVKCRSCQASLLSVITGGSLGITSVGLVTDLLAEDVLKFKNTQPVSPDEVIAFHQYLAGEKALIEKFK